MSSNQSNEPEAPSSQASTQNSSQKYVRQKSDIAWAHCTQVVEDGKSVLLCLYCKKIIRGGGINRLKTHLAGEKGQVEQCKISVLMLIVTLHLKYCCHRSIKLG